MKKKNKDWIKLPEILFIMLVSFSLIIHNVFILLTINNNFIVGIISLVTIGLGILLVYFMLKYRFQLEKNLKEINKKSRR